MKTYEILRIKDLVAKLNTIRFDDFKITTKVYKLTKKINEHIEIINNEQVKIAKEYALVDNEGNLVVNKNQYQFENDEKKQNYLKEMNSIYNASVDDIEKIEIPVESIQNGQLLSAEDMITLEILVNWV